MTFLIRSNLWPALTLSALVAFVILAFHGRIEGLGLGVFFILVWQVFTLDRLIIHPEDQKKADADLNIALFVSLHPLPFIAGLIASTVVLIAFCFIKPVLFTGYLFVILCSVLYIFPLPIIKKRLKQIAFLKSFYVPFAVFVSSLLLTETTPQGNQDLLICLLIYFLFLLNAALFDIKDVKEDTASGIKTFASAWGISRLIRVEFAVSTTLGLALVLFSSAPSLLALGVTFLLYGQATLVLLKTKSVKYLFGAIDGMNAVPLAVYLLLTAG
ncbi:MAG: UbiA family prenyltransferase [Deltaproteobacteria bacterium]|nr:UbiA family prenyltransferase [Deltaproteobacteria bacterium]